jgi:hypothetical protein
MITSERRQDEKAKGKSKKLKFETLGYHAYSFQTDDGVLPVTFYLSPFAFLR